MLVGGLGCTLLCSLLALSLGLLFRVQSMSLRAVTQRLVYMQVRDKSAKVLWVLSLNLTYNCRDHCRAGGGHDVDGSVSGAGQHLGQILTNEPVILRCASRFCDNLFLHYP